MEKLEFKLEQLYGKRSNYLSDTKEIIEKVKAKYFSTLYKMEELKNKNDFKLKIEAISKITKSDINTYFNSLFEAPTTANYLLTIKKIKEFLEKNEMKLKISSEEEEVVEKINYDNIEKRIKEGVKGYIDSLNLPLDFEYVLIEKKKEVKEKVKKDNTKSNSVEMYGKEYLNIDYISHLMRQVISKFSLLKEIIDSYSLLSVQQVDFSCNSYSAIKDCFTKVKNSKLQKVDVAAIHRALITSDTNDYDDIFSENYITFVATLLESAYFLCDYCLTYDNEATKHTSSLHKNEDQLKSYISDNLDIFMDRLSYIESVNAIDLYVKAYNSFIAFDEKDLSKELEG